MYTHMYMDMHKCMHMHMHMHMHLHMHMRISCASGGFHKLFKKRAFLAILCTLAPTPRARPGIWG